MAADRQPASILVLCHQSMSPSPDGAFSACLQFASTQAKAWVPHWLVQLKQALRSQEEGARSFVEKQAMGQSRSVLVQYHEEVAARFLAEIEQVINGAHGANPAGAGAETRTAFSLDALALVEHDAVQEKVDLTRLQQVVRMAAEDALPALDALLSRARGFERVRTDVNPLNPDVIVAALARALGSLHLDEAVRAQWMQTGAVLLGAELFRFYGAMADALVKLGVKPAGYVVVQRSEGRPASAASAPGAGKADPSVQRSGPNLSLDHLHKLLASTLKAAAAGDAGDFDQSQGLASSLASAVATQMLQRCVSDHRLLPLLRGMVQSLQPALMQLASTQPAFFADPANPAQRLLDAIALEGAVFGAEFDPGFVEFADRTHRVLGALQTVDAELPARMVAALQRFRGPASSARPPPSEGGLADDGDVAEEFTTDFMDTVPMERELMPMDLPPGARSGGFAAPVHRPV
jgi:hypothetical protein